MNMIEGIFETHLEVKNLHESMEFYEKKLGFKLWEDMKKKEEEPFFYLEKV